MPALQLLYDNHVNTYGGISDKYKRRFHPIGFDTLGRMHPDSSSFCTMLSSIIVLDLLRSTKELLPSRNALVALGGMGVPHLCVHSGAACLPGSGLCNAPVY